MKYLFLLTLMLSLTNCSKVDTPELASEASTWTFPPFIKADSINPILAPLKSQEFDCPISKVSVNWEERNVLNPTALVKDGKVYLIYRAQDQAMTSRLGLAISEDGLHFEKQPDPIFFPAEDSMKIYEWQGGVEDPRIVDIS